MALGVKIKKVKTKNLYSIEDFYEAIKDSDFTAGKPSLSKHGNSPVITFPALDSQNQVWILKTGFGMKSNKFSVQKQEQAGIGNMLANSAISSLTGGISRLGAIVSENSKKCEQLVEQTAKELNSMGL